MWRAQPEELHPQPQNKKNECGPHAPQTPLPHCPSPLEVGAPKNFPAALVQEEELEEEESESRCTAPSAQLPAHPRRQREERTALNTGREDHHWVSLTPVSSSNMITPALLMFQVQS